MHYLEGLKDPTQEAKIKDVYERACTIHHLKKPNIHLQWATFEESVKNFNRSAEILVNLERSVPNLLQVVRTLKLVRVVLVIGFRFQVAYRRINLERRRGDNDKVCQLYEHYISATKSKLIASNLAIKYARFNLKLLADLDKAIEIIAGAIPKDPNNPRLVLQLIDLSLQRDGVNEPEIVAHLDTYLSKDNIDLEQKVLFSQRKLEFLEDFGSDILTFQRASEEYQKYLKQYKEVKAKDAAKAEQQVGKKEKQASSHSSQSNSYNYPSYQNANSAASGYQQYSGTPQGQYNYSQYGQNEQYQYQNWQYQQGGYGGYNQWGGYGGGYGY